MSEEENGGAMDMRELVRWAEQTRLNIEALAERTQRSLDFLAEQQAQFSSDLQRTRAEREKDWEEQKERWRKADERWANTEAGIRALLAIVQTHEGEISALQESQARTDRQIAETGRQLAETGEKLSETGERVDALINTVERLISERRNGKADRDGEPGENREGG